eukprot:COSAG04_NODE_390_length_15167_cov_93.727900_14_plen_306_part_00
MVYVSAGRELTWRLSNSQKEATGRHRSATRTARSTPSATTAFPPRPPHQPRRRRRPQASRATPRRHRPRRAPAGRPAHSAAKRRATARRQAGTNATQRRHATCARRAAINTLWTAGRATSVWRLSAARRRHRRFPTQDVPSGRIRQPRPVNTAARESFRTGLGFSHRWRCAPVPLSPEISANGDLVYTACQDNGVPGFGKTVLLAGQILGLRSSRPPLRHVRTAGGTAAQMLAVNATDGSLVSSFQSETKPSLTSPPDEFAAPRLSADGGAVFVGCANSHLYALNATNLAVLWVGNTSGDECTSP